MNTPKTLLILAAGQGSRYGGNKQIESFGLHQEMIMDYSIYDAIQSKFTKVVFVIRKDFFEPFKLSVEKKWKNKIDIVYVFQEKENYCSHPNQFADRQKPWGTAHAILCASKEISEPFLMINADDFYGRSSFSIAFNFLEEHCFDNQYGLIAYKLSETVSKYGTVSRGICKVSDSQYLENIQEHKKIYVKENKIFSLSESNLEVLLDENSKVSMNFFCFHHSIFENLKIGFENFLNTDYLQNPHAEFLISNFIDECMKKNGLKVLIKNTNEKWFGVTYKEDKEIVKQEIKNLIEKKVYPSEL